MRKAFCEQKKSLRQTNYRSDFESRLSILPLTNAGPQEPAVVFHAHLAAVE